MKYTEDTLVQQAIAEPLELELVTGSRCTPSTKSFRSGEVLHWYGYWVDVARKHCRDSGEKYS